MSNTHKIKKFVMGIKAKDIDGKIDIQNHTKMSTTRFEFYNGVIDVLSDETIEKNEGNWTFIVGEPTNMPDLSSIKNYKDAIKLLPQSDGAFIFIYYDATNKKIVIISDFLRLQPFYYRYNDLCFIATGETKSIGNERDLSAWGAFVSWGHLIGSRTLAKDIKKLEASTILIYDIQSDTIEKRKYWEFSYSGTYSLDDIIDSFNESIKGYVKFLPDCHLLLSGGFDSRFILFSMKSLGFNPDAIIVNHDDEYANIDGILAESVAKTTNTKYRKFIVSPNFFSSQFYLEYLNITDGASPSLFIFISKISHILASVKPKAILDGLISGYLLNSAHYLEGGGLSDLVSKKNDFNNPTWQLMKKIFRPEVVNEMYAGCVQDTKEEIEKYVDDSFGVSEFILLNRGARRVAINPVQAYANYTVPIIPGLTKDFINCSVSIPFDAKHNGGIFTKIFNKNYPKACSIPFISGSQLIPLRRNLYYFSSKLKIAFRKKVARYPNIFKHSILYNKHSVKRSDFFTDTFLEDDTHIVVDNLKKMDKKDPQYITAWKIVFHWYAWDLIHKGRLQELNSF